MASPIKITITDDNVDEKTTVKLVRFDGQLDESNVDESSHTIYNMIEEVPAGTFLLFDMGGLGYMNSKAIGYLTDWHLKINEKNGEILLVRAKENIVDILNVVGLTQIIKSFATLDEGRLAVLQIMESRS